MIKYKKVTPVILTIFTILLCCAMIFPAFAANDVPESVSGTRKTLTFVVYKDSDPNAPKTAAQEKAIISQVKDYMYGAAGKDISNDTQVYGPDDSLRGWYYRSSYGKLDITGNVYILHISKNEESTHLNYSELLNLAYKKYKTQINWDSYFVRSNNAPYPTIKGVYFIQGSEYSVFLSSDGFALGDVTTTSVNDPTTHEPIFYADCTGFAYLTSRHILNDNRGVLKVVAHETCHMFGFPDIYDIAGKNENGACATTIMDNYTNTDLNDIPSIYKYLLGWMDAKIVELDGDTYTEKLQTSSYQNKLLGNQLLIIKLYESGDGRNASTMFYAVEYLTKEYNNNFGGVRVWLIETKNGTLEDWRNDVLSNSNNGRIYVSDHINYIKALSADGEISYLLKPGMKINDSTTPAFKIPSGMNYYYQHDGAPHDSVTIRDWRNSNYQLSVDSYQNANRTVMITLKSLSKNVLTLNYISDGKTYTKNTYTNGTTFTVKTDTSLKLKKDGYLFVGWDLEMKSSDKKYDVTVATFKGGETITPATIGKAIMESNRNHHPTVYPLSLMEASFSANLVAKWRKAITVTIDPNGGKINGKTDKQVKVLPEHERIILDTPVGETFTATFKNGTTTKSTIKATRAFLCWNVIDQDTNVGHNSLYDYENTYISSENGINQLFLAQYDLPQITMPEALTKTGYIFRGWKDTQTNTIYTAKQKALLKKNTTYSAVWEKTYPYTLTVYKNESEWKTSEKDGITVKAINTSTQESFVLKNTANTGKFTASLPEGEYVIHSPLYKGASVASTQKYAKTFTVSDSDTNGRLDYYSVTLSAGTGIDKTKLTGGTLWIIKGGSRTIAVNTGVLNGYQWSKWTYVADGKTYSTQNKVTISNIQKSYSLKANATAKTIKVYYNANGGKCAAASHKNSDGTVTYYHAVGDNKMLRFSKTKAVTANSATYYDTYTYKKGSFDPYNANGALGLSKVGYAAAGKYTIGGTTGTAYAQDGANAAIAASLDKLIESGRVSVQLYPVWTPKTMTITLDANNGTGGTTKLYEVYGSKFYTNTSTKAIVTTVTVPTRTGYTFDGYYSSESNNNGTGTKLIDANGNILVAKTKWSANATIYAKWIIKTIKVYYNANGGNCAATSHKSTDGKTTYYHAVGTNKMLRFSKTAAVTANSATYYDTYTYKKGSFDPYNANGALGLSKVGYTAAGKYTIGGTTGTAYAQDGANAAIAAALDKLIESGRVSVQLYPVWTPKTMTITLDMNNGTGGTTKLYEVYGSKFYTNTSTKAIATTVTIPTRTGYVFDGYYSSESNNNGTGTKLIDANGNILVAKTKWSANKTIYARWIKHLGEFKCTAYCGCAECSENSKNLTSTGVVAKANHTIAVDPSVIPLGSTVIINGKTYKAEDVGGGIKGKRIDIFFDNHTETENFGVKTLSVYLVP